MKVAALQLNAQNDVAENLRATEQQVDEACARGARLVVLPEGFAFLGPEEEKVRYAEDLNGTGPVMSALSKWAQAHSVSLLAGGLAERRGDNSPPYNTSVLISPSGEVVATYRKMHLFDVDLGSGTRLFESRATTRGTEPVVARLDGWGLGLSICYDVRFPELYAWQRDEGADILTVPSAFTQTTGEAHWHVLLRARAIETQCFVIAAAQWGRHPRDRKTFGHAIIIDPWGRILAEAPPGPGCIVAELDRSELERIRTAMPVHQHRHPFFRN